MSEASARSAEVVVQAGSVPLAGTLALPARPRGVVLFAHGSGSSRFSSRNRFVAGALQEAGFATLLFDLLTGPEGELDECTARLRFDIPLLAGRLREAVDWARAQPALRGLPLGLFGASTGAAAALIAAAERPADVAAVVSRGGRPDLAGDALRRVRAPTLLIVGGQDGPVITMNRQAAALIPAPRRLEVVPGATHLFPEPGKLEEVAALARSWFEEHLARRRRPLRETA